MLTMVTVAFLNRVAVIESPVDEDTTQSGLIVPHAFEGSPDVVRAAVISVGLAIPPLPALDFLTAGTIVYYRRQRGVQVRDLIVVEYLDILAYEEEAL